MAAQQSGISAALQPVLRLSEWFIGCDKTENAHYLESNIRSMGT